MMSVRRDLLPALALLGIIGFGVPRAARAAEGAPRPARTASAPLAPSEAPKRMTVPEGFKVTLFAGEPDVVQPIAFTIDDGPALGRRVLLLPDLAGRARRARTAS